MHSSKTAPAIHSFIPCRYDAICARRNFVSSEPMVRAWLCPQFRGSGPVYLPCLSRVGIPAKPRNRKGRKVVRNLVGFAESAPRSHWKKAIVKKPAFEFMTFCMSGLDQMVAGCPRSATPRCSGNSSRACTQSPRRRAFATVSISWKVNVTKELATCTFCLFLFESHGKPRGYCAERNGGGPAALAYKARVWVLQGGVAATTPYCPSAVDSRRLARSSSSVRSPPSPFKMSTSVRSKKIDEPCMLASFAKAVPWLDRRCMPLKA